MKRHVFSFAAAVAASALCLAPTVSLDLTRVTTNAIA